MPEHHRAHRRAPTPGNEASSDQCRHREQIRRRPFRGSLHQARERERKSTVAGIPRPRTEPKSNDNQPRKEGDGGQGQPHRFTRQPPTRDQCLDGQHCGHDEKGLSHQACRDKRHHRHVNLSPTPASKTEQNERSAQRLWPIPKQHSQHPGKEHHQKPPPRRTAVVPHEQRHCSGQKSDRCHGEERQRVTEVRRVSHAG
jgi:hypothetical protein